MKTLIGLLLAGLASFSAMHCAAPSEVDGESDDALTSEGAALAGKESDDPIDVTHKMTNGFPGAFASPSIVRVGDTYHAWLAKQRAGGKVYNIAHATLGPGGGPWKLVDDALPTLGKGALNTGAYAVWAPAVAQIDDSHWMLYYAATLEGHGEKKCIWRAHAASPAGPFVDDFDGPLVCLDGPLWAIDPDVVKDAQGNWHIVARLDEPGGINTIQIHDLGPFGEYLAPGSSWKMLTHNSPSSWEQPVMENAAMVRLGPPDASSPPHWYVFYSGRAWSDSSYAIGYADCGEWIEGPCEKKTVDGPWLRTYPAAGVYGPGTPTFYKDESGQTLMSVQAWRYPLGIANSKNKQNGQMLRTYRISVGPGYVPSVEPVSFDY